MSSGREPALPVFESACHQRRRSIAVALTGLGRQADPMLP